MTVASRVLEALQGDFTEPARVAQLEGAAGGTISVVVKLDAAGFPKRIAVRTEVERAVERTHPRAMAG